MTSVNSPISGRRKVALSRFTISPRRHLNKSHREEAILVKDLIRNALREAEKHGKNGSTRSDLEKINSMVDPLHGSGGKAKAIFACGQQGFWREFDIPAQLLTPKIAVSQRFHLKPLAAVLDGEQRACVLLADRTKARVFELVNDEVVEKEDFINELTRRGKSDGYAGYDAGHAERKQTNEAMQHFRLVAERIEQYFERGGCDRLLIGCRDDVWSEIEPQLQSLARQHLVGHFRIDPKVATPEQVKQMAHEQLARYSANMKQELDPRSDRRGASQRSRRDRTAARVALAGDRRGLDAAAGIELSCGRREVLSLRTYGPPRESDLRGVRQGEHGTGRHRRRHRGPCHPHWG